MKPLFAAVLMLALAGRAYGAAPHGLYLGAAWYPEQWPEQQWEGDLQLMQDAHMNVVRVGEFAWSTMEPREHVYELDWLERAIALAAKHHIQVVIGTPTDAPPAWMTTKYPDVLGMNADGHWREHGGRRQFNYASDRYRQFCAQIVAELARRFGHNPNVIGWQIGNEYTDESFDPATRALYQQYLRKKFGSLENLNRAWAADCGPQPFTDWSQVPLDPAGGGPGQLLEHKHFVTATWRSFQKNQIDVLRPLIAPGQFITSNIGGLAWSDNWDHYAITADLDIASWDDYVGQGHLDAAKNAMLNDFVRGWKRQNFWVMETEPASVNWAPINNELVPGETRALAWQTIGHGADAVLYWQWRDALNGQEQYHGAIAGPDGKPLPVYEEIAELGRDLELTRPALEGTSPHAKIAILHDYDSRWAIDFQPFTTMYDQQKVLLRFYSALSGGYTGLPSRNVDIVDPSRGSLDGYNLVLAPSLNVISDQLAKKLLHYVRGGGYLVLGPRAGMKDENNALNVQRQPGPLVEALRGRVEQYYAPESPVTISGLEGRVNGAKADLWGEALSTRSPDTKVLLTYRGANAWLDGKPAMIGRALGKGTIAYLGTVPDEASMRALLTWIGFKAGAPPPADHLPDGVELCMRDDASKWVMILINHRNTQVEATVYGRLRSLMPEISTTATMLPTMMDGTKVTLPAQGVAVLVAEKRP